MLFVHLTCSHFASGNPIKSFYSIIIHTYFRLFTLGLCQRIATVVLQLIDSDRCEWGKFLLVPAYPGCPGSKAVKRSLLLLLLLYCSLIVYLLLFNASYYLHSPITALGHATGRVHVSSSSQ